jgi:hypothetical protein
MQLVFQSQLMIVSQGIDIILMLLCHLLQLRLQLLKLRVQRLAFVNLLSRLSQLICHGNRCGFHGTKHFAEQ